MHVLLAITIALLQVAIEPRPKPAPKEATPRADIRVDTTLILVPVTVSDPLNRPVSGLERDNFRVFDNGTEQAISQFAMDDEPIAIGFVFDSSGSMGSKLERSRLAAAHFLRTANEEDEFFLVTFDSAPHLLVPLTRNTAEIQNKLLFSRSHGSTALLDAIYLALHEMRKSHKNKKALLVISDGGDNHSRYTPAEVNRVVQESDVLIYAIGVFGGGTTPEEAGGAGLLSKIAEQTGARLFEAVPSELPDTALKIGLELRNRYVLGYIPNHPTRDGRYHKIQVKVLPPRGLPKLRPHWRMGYYAPLD
jgi:Ca-activated chloride channel homolog